MFGESYGNRTRINGITIRGVNRYTNNSIGASVWNRTTIPGFVNQYIIHYTTEAN